MADLPAIIWPLQQKAVYWPPVNPTGNYDKKTYGTPVQIDCRWDDSIREDIKVDGKIVESSAGVMVDRKLKLEGVLWLGLKKDLTSLTLPFSNEGAKKIAKLDRTPDLDANECLYEAFV